MEKKRCYGCMRQKTGTPICEHCGYDERSGNAPHQLPAGTVLREQYLVGRVLGQGGFGITYLGWDLYLDIPVAIKEYYPTGMVMREASQTFSVVNCLDDDGDRFHNNRDRFMREAKMLARFAYVPEIVQIKNFFLANNTAYIVMEYVQGITLKEYIRRRGGTLEVQETLAILRPIMVGLSKLHRAGLIHRDISPDNIMMLPGGGAKLLDFGAVRDVGTARVDQEISRSTDAILKQGYAPIEQYQQKGALGPWSDVYALCATVYYCLTGTVPPDSPARMLEEEKVVFDPGTGLDRRQIRALTRGMAVRAADRPRNMDELHMELFGTPIPRDEDDQTDPFAGEDPEQPGDDRSDHRKKKNWILPVIAAALIVGGLAAWFLTRPREQRLSDRIPTHQTTQGTVDSQEETMPEAKDTPETTEPQRPVVQNPRENTLMEHKVEDVDNGPSERAFGMAVSRDQVQSITVLYTTAGAPKTAADVSADHNGKVLAWVEANGELYDLYLAAEGGVYAPADSSYLFAFFSNLKSIQFNDAFFTDNVQNAMGMFNEDFNLVELDLSGFRTPNLTNMAWMFSNCESLTQLDVSGFDTSRVVQMNSAFQTCLVLRRLDVSNFDTSSATTMRYMFTRCESLQQLDVSGFDTSYVTEMQYMFNECSSLKSLDVTGFDTSQVADMSRMFADCQSLTDLDVSAFDTSRVTNMSYMFYGCHNVKFLDMSGFKTAAVTDMSGMFEECSSLKALDVSGFDTSAVTSMRAMFEDCPNIRVLEVDEFDTSLVTDLSYMFNNCNSLAELDLAGWNTANVTEMVATFRGCKSLTRLDLSGFNTARVTTMARLVEDSAALKELNLSGLETNSVNDMDYMFSGCSGLETLNVSSFNTSAVEDMHNMFYNCSGLRSLDLSRFDTSNVRNMECMLYGCDNLTNLKLGNFNTSKVTSHTDFMEQGKKVNGKDWTTLFG